MILQRSKGAGLRRFRVGWAAVVVTLGAAVQAAPDFPLLGQPAPDFALHAVSGGNVRLSEHLGEVVVLSFWGSRCTPCREQLAALDRSLRTYRSAGLQVYGINVDDDQSRALSYAHGEKLSFTLLLDPQKSVSRSYEIDNLPMTVLIDRSGVVRQALRDYNGKSDELYLQQLRKLLNE